ncbi:MAG: hypothetical protein GF334_07970 [Candidatus Altiarchaeales archaeon]|nr:hypothetical protein [Candidatus Altiarchaeales archaeon]
MKRIQILKRLKKISPGAAIELLGILLVAVAAVGFLVLSFEARGADFYQWETEAGTLEITDDPKRIPESFRESAQERSFEELDGVRWTPVQKETPLHIPTPVVVEKNPHREETCDGPVRFLESEWRQFDDRTKQVFIVRDECGNVILESFSWPELQINR